MRVGTRGVLPVRFLRACVTDDEAPGTSDTGSEGVGDGAVAYAWLGWPEDGPTLRLDHRAFAYAGKFVMSSTGKAVAYDPGPTGERDLSESASVVAAAAFSADRSDASTLKLRYLTVRDERRGDGLGARLAAFVAVRAGERYDRVAIGVNNPFSYEALYKAGFAWTGGTSGLAELVLARPAGAGDPGDRAAARYRAGLERFREREDLDEAEVAFIDGRAAADPPAVVPPPDGPP